jgi:Tol biopolymer transport system component
MRARYLTAFLLTTGICFSQASHKKAVGCDHCFSEPQSKLLFSSLSGDDVAFVTPTETFVVLQPPGPGRPEFHNSPPLAISPSGDRVAESLIIQFLGEKVNCGPSDERWCDQYPQFTYKSVMGVYSVRDNTWKQYGNFCSVGLSAFSPNGKKLVFKASGSSPCTKTTNVDANGKLWILDLETGQMTPLPGAESIDYVYRLSWSPDGKFLAATDGRGCGKIVCGHIVLVDVATGEMKTIAEGTDPSWSPKGDWIAYDLAVRCMIIHPDGTGARSVLEKEHKWMNYALNAPIVWSPDGERLLLNQQQIFGDHFRVLEVDLATGHAVMKSKNGEVVMGWVPYSGK